MCLWWIVAPMAQKGKIMGQLSTLILATTSTGSAKAAIYASAFAADSLHFFTANSDQEVCAAIAALPVLKARGIIKGEQFQTLGDAIGAAMKAGRAALPDGAGWIGAKLGAFSKASKETRAPYLAAHAVACETFTTTLSQSPLWRDATEAEKLEAKEKREAAKAEKAAKAATGEAEKVAAIKAALIASGELVPSDTRTIGKATAGELIGALYTLLDEGVTMPVEALDALLQAAKAKAKEPATV